MLGMATPYLPQHPRAKLTHQAHSSPRGQEMIPGGRGVGGLSKFGSFGPFLDQLPVCLQTHSHEHMGCAKATATSFRGSGGSKALMKVWGMCGQGGQIPCPGRPVLGRSQLAPGRLYQMGCCLRCMYR